MSDLVPYEASNGAALALPTAWESQMHLCETLARSGLIPAALRGKPSDILIIMMTGHELGLGPMLALRSIYVVDGKPTLSADLAAALILRSTACGEFRCVESTEQKAAVVARRRDQSEPTRIEYSLADAKLAGLVGKQNWTRHPKAMLRARAILAAGRLVFPDLLAGVYDPDELDAAPMPAPRASVVHDAPPPTPSEDELTERLRASMLATTTVDELKAWSAAHAKDPQKRKKAIAKDYAAHMAALKEAADADAAKAAQDVENQNDAAYDEAKAEEDRES